jgi:Peptidase A4 family
MQRRDDFSKLAALVIMASLLLTLTRMAMAESDAVRAIYLSAANMPTNLAGIYTYTDPPKAFNPLTASDAELATYGFPQRPDKNLDPDHYALWERAMKAAKIRWRGELKPMPRMNHAGTPVDSLSAKQLEQAQAQAQSGPSQPSNVDAAGVVLNNKLKMWSATKSFNDIWTVISVPVAQLPFDNSTGCTAEAYFAFSYAGIDGKPFTYNGTPEFDGGEQAGVWDYVNCPGTVNYYAFIGWSGNDEAVFALNPGDLFYTEIHAFGGCNDGSAFVEDLTTLTYNSYAIPNPCGVSQTGHSAEWVVDRAGWPLPNTISIFFDGGAVATGAGTRFYPGSQATTTQVLTMTDDAGDQPIEVVSQGSSGYEGQHALFFQTTGCAFAGGCTP